MPVPDSLRAELQHYMIGQKLRALRLRRSMGLMQLGKQSGLSPALLSKIENSKLVPTIPTLLRVAMVFDVPLEHFFCDEHKRRIISITRKADWRQRGRPEMVPEYGLRLTSLDLGPGERKFQAYLAEFPALPAAELRAHLHVGFEFVHVLSGTLQLFIGSDDHLLQAGDSIYFDSGLRHAYCSAGEEKCTALMVLAHADRNASERRMERLEGVHAFRKSLRDSVRESPHLAPSATFTGNGSPGTKDDLHGRPGPI